MSNPTALQVMRVALQQYGYTEDPPGSNRTKYGKAYGWNGVFWCAQYVWWCGDQPKGDNPIYKSANAADIEDLTVKKKGGMFILEHTANNSKKQKALPKVKFGDIISFNFNGGSDRDHTGLIVGRWENYIYCIEGNTSFSDSGSQSNGGAVALRERFYTTGVCIVRPKYEPFKFYTPTTQYTGTVPKLPGRGWYQYGDKNAKELQQALTWANGYALDPDGDIGGKTFAEIVIFQVANGLEPDGQFGEKCIDKLNELIKKHNAGSTSTTSPAKPVEEKKDTVTETSWQDKAVAWAKKIAADNSFHYVKWKSKDKKTHECPVCKNHPKGEYHGWNCIGFAFACWRHGGLLKSKCNCGVIANETWEKILHAKTDAEAKKIASNAVGIDVEVIRNGGKAIPQSKLKKGDICSYFIGEKYQHTFFYMGDGKIADSTSGRSDNIKAGVAFSGNYKSKTKVAIRPAAAKATTTAPATPEKPAEKTPAASDTTVKKPPKLYVPKAGDKCYDLSDHQGALSKSYFEGIKKKGVTCVILRSSYTRCAKFELHVDAHFLNNIKNAIAAGMHIGIYHFSAAIKASESPKEAEFCLKTIAPFMENIDLPVGFDCEFGVKTSLGPPRFTAAVAKKLGKTGMGKIIDGFCSAVKAAGYETMLYANLSMFNNYLPANIYTKYKIWVAQYASKCQYKHPYYMWQFTSNNGKLDENVFGTQGTSGETESSGKKAYPGELPSTKLVKTNSEVIDDNIKFLRWISGDNDFHYGYTNKHGSNDSKKWNPNAHHNGCYFCGTNVDHGSRSKKGIKEYQHTYCCNPLITAAWAHGGCVPQALALCRKGSSWDFAKGHGYDKSPMFKNLGHPAMKELKRGDVLCNDNHVAEYIGGGLIAEASGGDDNVKGSKKWNNSIHIVELTEKRYAGFKRVHRYIGSVNTTCCIYHGEVGRRVELTQAFLKWYGCDIEKDGLFGDETMKYVKKFQKASGITDDGIVGPNTINAMKAARK